MSFGLFIVPVTILFAFLLPLGAREHPALTAVALVLLAVTVTLSSLCFVYVEFKKGRYAQEHHFLLWKKSKSFSLKDRRAASKEIDSLAMQVPSLERSSKRANRIAFVLFLIWAVVFLAIVLFIMFSGT